MHGNLKNVPKCSHSNILQSQWRNCGVNIDTDFLKNFNYSTQLFCKLFLTQLTRISIWIIISFIEYYRHMISKTSLSNYLPFIDTCVYSLCRISDTGIIMTSQRRCHARDSQSHAYIFYNAWLVATRFGNSLADFRFAMYQNESIYVIIGFKHDVACIVRLEALRSHSDTSVHEARSAECIEWSSWPLRASDLTMHATSCLYL